MLLASAVFARESGEARQTARPARERVPPPDSTMPLPDTFLPQAFFAHCPGVADHYNGWGHLAIPEAVFRQAL
jgi:hypothetical protein